MPVVANAVVVVEVVVFVVGEQAMQMAFIAQEAQKANKRNETKIRQSPSAVFVPILVSDA